LAIVYKISTRQKTPSAKHASKEMAKGVGKATMGKQSRFLTNKMSRAQKQEVKFARIKKAKDQRFGNGGKKFLATDRKEPWQEAPPIGAIAAPVKVAQEYRPKFADLEPFLRSAPLEVVERLADPSSDAAAAAAAAPAAFTFALSDGAAFDPTSPAASAERKRRRELVSSIKKGVLASSKSGLLPRRLASWLDGAWQPNDDVLRCLLFDWRCAAPSGAELRLLRREVALGGGEPNLSVARTARFIEGSTGRAICRLALTSAEGTATDGAAEGSEGEAGALTLSLERNFAGRLRLVGVYSSEGEQVPIEAFVDDA